MRANLLKPLSALCGLVVLASVSQASVIDASILLEKAANSRTLTVKYDGAEAASLVMFINKVKAETRPLDAKETRGELALPIDTGALPDGESTIEVQLLDASGKVLGSEITKVQIDRTGNGPAFLISPHSGDTVQSLVEIKVGFKTDIRNVFVSFFVDDDFKALKNYPPYGYVWDSSKVLNGWHEIQAWAIDDMNNTFKTEKYRIYVNNPGGQTPRQSQLTKPTVDKTDQQKPATDTAPKTTGAQTTPTISKNNTTPGVAPADGVHIKLPIVEGSNIATKPAANAGVTSTRVSAPTVTPSISDPEIKAQSVTKVAPVEPTVSRGTLPAANTAVEANNFTPKMVPIKTGARLTAVKNFGISMDGVAMKFDVPGRVQKGIPTAPFRYLFEHKGMDVLWSQKDKTVTGKSSDSSIWLQIGNPVAKFNGKDVTLESSPYLFHSRTFVPLSFVGDVLDVDILFDPSTEHMMITSRSAVAKIPAKNNVK